MDTPSISNTNITLTRLSDSSSTAITVTYDDTTKTATINPDANLTDNTFYRLTVTTGVTDTSSNALASNQTIDFMVGEDITHSGYSYKVLKSPITGENWLDRNLGAYQVCTKSRDDTTTPYADDAAYVTDQEDCFGDYYQWGRLADGHQEAITDVVNTPNKTASNTTATRATSYTNVGHGDFIPNSTSPYDWVENNTQDTNNVDDDGALRTVQWSKTDGTSICPTGFRVPTSTELYAETTQYSGTDNETTGAVDVTNRDTAFKNFLRLPVSGYRYNYVGSLNYQGNIGVVWSSSVSGSYSWNLSFYDSSANESSSNRAYGFSVRCVKD